MTVRFLPCVVFRGYCSISPFLFEKSTRQDLCQADGWVCRCQLTPLAGTGVSLTDVPLTPGSVLHADSWLQIFEWLFPAAAAGGAASPGRGSNAAPTTPPAGGSINCAASRTISAGVQLPLSSLEKLPAAFCPCPVPLRCGENCELVLAICFRIYDFATKLGSHCSLNLRVATGDSGRHPGTPGTARGTFADLDIGGEHIVHRPELTTTGHNVHVLPRVASGVSTGAQYFLSVCE